MAEILKEYLSWYRENDGFYHHLKDHDSILYTRFSPVYEVLNYLYENYKNQSIDEDIEKIMQVGLEYLYHQFFTCKVYLDQYFNQDFHQFLHYDRLVNFLLFVEDLRYELLEKQVNYDQNELDDLIDEVESMITQKKPVINQINAYLDSRLSKIIDVSNHSFHSIIDIFVEIGETLGLEIDTDEEIMIGKDI